MAKTINYDVDYDVLDQFKRESLKAAQVVYESVSALGSLGFKMIPESMGESVCLIDCPGMILAFVVEGLGTFNKVAEEILQSSERVHPYFANISLGNFATIANDLTASGAYPLAANQFIAVGDEKWLENEQVRTAIIRGWQFGCNESGSLWGGGETQKLRDIVNPDSAVLAGAAVGVMKPKRRRIRGNIRVGDAIVIVRSSGVHANGITMVRDIAKRLPEGYLTRLQNGETFGDALLHPQHTLYGKLTHSAWDRGVRIHYVSNITGHGWRKIMRSAREFTYIIDKLPDPQPVFRYIQEKAGVSYRTMYETFNMGGGIAYFMPHSDVSPFCRLGTSLGYECIHAGRVEKGPRRVILAPIDETFEADTYSAR